jgi:hypothetical protein
MAILSTTLSNTATAISPALTTDSAVTVMLFCNLNTPDPSNPESGKEFLDVYAVASGDTPSSSNKICSQIPIDAGDTFTFSTERIVLSPGDRIYASAANIGQLAVTISYVII